MRVAMIIQGFHPRIGGAERQLQALAPRLQRRGVDVHVVTRRYPGMTAEATVDGVPVHRIAIPGPKPVASLAFTAGALLRLRALRPDVIHAHELLSPATTGLLAATVLSTPLVVKVLISGEVRYLRDERPLGRQRIALLRRRVDAFLAISQDIDTELERSGIPPGRRRFVPNGVDTERYAPPSPSRREDRRSELGLGDGPAVAYVGRLAPQKNLHQLVEVWAQVRERHPEAQLLLAGTGPDEQALREAAGPGVRLLGGLPDVVALLQAADAFVLPSWQEGLSNALLEAMACGLPVIASEVGGARELIEPDVSGLLVPAGDADALRTALLSVVADAELRRRLGERARTTILDRYALDDRVTELHDLYQELAG